VGGGAPWVLIPLQGAGASVSLGWCRAAAGCGPPARWRVGGGQVQHVGDEDGLQQAGHHQGKTQGKVDTCGQSKL
jgi:hypothetical protein